MSIETKRPFDVHRVQQSHELAAKSMRGFADHLPEVSERYAELAFAARDLIEYYQIEPTLFEDETKALLFTGAVAQYCNPVPSGEPIDIDQLPKNHPNNYGLSSLVTLIAKDHASNIFSFDEEAPNLPNFGEYGEVLHNEAVAADLKRVMDGPLLDPVRKRLGVSEADEPEYILSVKNMAADWQFTDDHDTSPELEAYKARLFAQHDAVKQQYPDYKMPHGWVQWWTNHAVLNILLPEAERLIHGDLELYRSFAGSHERIIKLLEHEYVHVRGSYRVEAPLYFAAALEELRADSFAESSGYPELAAWNESMLVATGFDIQQYILSQVKGGSFHDLVLTLAQNTDLETASRSAAAATWTSYDFLSRKVSMYLKACGSTNKVGIKAAYNRVMNTPDEKDAIVARTQQWVEQFVSQGGDIADHLGYRFMYYDLAPRLAVERGLLPKESLAQLDEEDLEISGDLDFLHH